MDNNKKKPRAKAKKAADYYDLSLVAVIILLTCFGLIMLYSTSAYTSQVEYGDDMYLLKRQAMISAGGIVLALIISRIDYHILKYFTTFLYLVAAILMCLVRTPLGVEVNGARRWLAFGPLQFQPSEIAKIAAIVCLSYMISKMGKQIGTWKGTATLLVMGGVLALIAYKITDNLSTAIIIMGITAGMVFLAHPLTKPFLVTVGVLAVAVIGFIGYVSVAFSLDDTNVGFRLRRVLTWLHPESDASDNGYQTLQALYAIGSGGFFGKGLGNSIQKLGSVPEAQNDMIFSIICEELGICGAIMIMVLFMYLLYRLFFIAQNAADLFGSLLVSGVFIHIALQIILNICVVVNVIPNTGVTLPFFSYGGTSILFLLAEMGMALSVSRRIKFQDPV